jgi:hypothetical protein
MSEIADYSKRSFENGTKTLENLLGVRSLDKAIEVQTEYARTAYEDYVTYTRKLGELGRTERGGALAAGFGRQ